MNYAALYRNIKDKNLINNIYSKYWIYDIDDNIQYSNGSQNREVKICFFDRLPQNSGKLSELSVVLNGSSVSLKNFKYVDMMRDPSLMYCEIIIDSMVDIDQLYITSYIFNNEKVNLSGDYYIQGLLYNGDDEKLKMCKELMGETSFMIAPEYNNMLWFCGCGHVNVMGDHICQKCGQEKQKMISIANMSNNDIVERWLPSKFVIDLDMPVEDKFNAFVDACVQRYNVSRVQVKKLFNEPDLVERQHEMAVEKIQDYVQSTSINWNLNASFEDNIDRYVSGVTTGYITKDLVLEYVDIDQLKDEYETKILQQKSKKTKGLLYGGIGAVVVVALIVAGVVFSGMLNGDKEEPKQPTNEKSEEVVNNSEDKKEETSNKEETKDPQEELEDEKKKELEKNIEAIRKQYGIVSDFMKTDDCTKYEYENKKLYYDQDRLVAAVIEDKDYEYPERYFYFYKDQLIFSSYDGKEIHKFYFKDNELIQWKTKSGKEESINDLELEEDSEQWEYELLRTSAELQALDPSLFEDEKYKAGENYPIGTYKLRQGNVLVRKGPDNKSYDVLKTDEIIGDTKKDKKAMLARGTELEIEEIEHSDSGYWGKIKNYDNAWICLYYERSYKGDREFAEFVD